MAQTVTQIRVFVGSPGDTQRERFIMDEVVHQINDGVLAEDKRVTLRLVRWERDAWPGFGQDAQDVINQQIGPYDIFVGIMRNRLGTPTRRAVSGSVEEFERAYQSWFKHKIPTIMLYFSKEPVHVADLEQLEEVRKVLEFKKRVESLGGLSWPYETVDDFRRLIRNHLEQEILKWSASGDPPIVPSSGPRQERFLVPSDWPKLMMIGDWIYDSSHPRVHGSGVYDYLLSGGEYGHRPFRVKAKFRFFGYDLHRGGTDNGNAGIVFGWKGTEGASTYLNLLFTGTRVVLEEVGSSGGDAYFDFQHLDAGSKFQIEEGRQYVVVLSVGIDAVTLHVDNVMIYSTKAPRDPRGKVGLRPWRARIECDQFDVVEL